MFLLLCISCGQVTSERSKILFLDSSTEVKNILLRVEQTMARIANPDKNSNTNYFYKNDDLYINSKRVSIKDIRKSKSLSMIEQSEITSFLHDIGKLKRNQITYCYYEKAAGVWLFGYLDRLENDFYDDRDIWLYQEHKFKDVKKYFTVLDSLGEIYLLKPKRILE